MPAPKKLVTSKLVPCTDAWDEAEPSTTILIGDSGTQKGCTQISRNLLVHYMSTYIHTYTACWKSALSEISFTSMSVTGWLGELKSNWCKAISRTKAFVEWFFLNADQYASILVNIQNCYSILINHGQYSLL